MATEIQRILIKYEADIKELQKKLAEVSDAVDGVAKANKEAGQAAKKSGEEQESAAKKAGKSVGGFEAILKRTAKQIATVYSVKEIIQFTSESVKLANIQLKAEAQLLKALNGREDVQRRLLKTASDLQKQTIFGDEVIIQQQAFLASLGFSEDKINDVIAASVDLSAATGLTLEGSVRNLAKTYSGLSGELGELIPQLRGLTAEQLKTGEGVKVATELFKGQAAIIAQTGTGPIVQLQNAFGDLRENLGKLILSSGGFNSLLDGFSDAIGFLNRIIPKTGQYSKELAGQRDEINVLTRQILLANEGEEERSNLITELTTKYPDFLAGLNAENVSNEQLATRLKEVNGEYVKRIALAIKSEDLEAQQQKTAAILVKSEERRVTLIEKLAAAQRKFNLELDPTQDLATQVEQAIAGLTSQSNGLGVAFNPALRAIKGLDKAFLNLRMAEADFARETLESEGIAAEIDALAKRLGISLEQATLGVESGALKLGEDIGADVVNGFLAEIDALAKRLGISFEQAIRGVQSGALKLGEGIGADVVNGAADKVKEDARAAIILELQKQLDLIDFRIKFGVDPEGVDLIGELSSVDPITAQTDALKGLEAQIIQNGNTRAAQGERIIDDINAETQAEQKREEATRQAIGSTIQIVESLGQVFANNAEAQRRIALFQIAINQALAIAEAVKAGAGLQFPANIPAILSGIAAVTMAFAQVKQLEAQAPAFATGTSDAPGGLSLVGEKGPEYVSLPKGSRVFTAEASKKERSLIDALNAGRHEDFIFDHYLKPFAEKLQNSREGWGYDDFQLRQAVRSNKTIELGPKTIRKLSKGQKKVFH